MSDSAEINLSAIEGGEERKGREGWRVRGRRQEETIVIDKMKEGSPIQF